MLEQHFQDLEKKMDLALALIKTLQQENRYLKQVSAELEKKNQLAGTRLEKVIKQLKELDTTP